MTNTIQLKRSFTVGAEPASLAPGEVAVNVADKKVWIGDQNSTPVLINDKAELLNYLPLAGGTMSGAIDGPLAGDTLHWESGPFSTSISSDGTTLTFGVNGGDATFTLRVDAFAASRPIELPVHALEDNHAARVDYVNQRIAALGVPTPQVDKLGGVYAAEAPVGQAQYGISTSGAPIFKDIAVPYPAADKLGGVLMNNAPPDQYVAGIQADGSMLYRPLPAAGTDYTLPTASATVLGGVKVGAGLAVDASGVLSTSGTATAYLPLAGGTMTGMVSFTGSGTTPMRFGTAAANYNLTLLPSEGGVQWRFDTLPLFIMSKTELQAHKPLVLHADPTAAFHAATKQYVDSMSSTYTLPIASASRLGGVKIGAGLTIDATGVLAANAASQYLSKSGDVMNGFLGLNATSVSTFNGTSVYLYYDGTYMRCVMPSGRQGWLVENATGILNITSGLKVSAASTFDQTITMSTAVTAFQFGTTGYNVFGGTGGVAVRSNNTNLQNITTGGINNGVQMVTPATGNGVVFGSGGAALSRGSASGKIASSGMIELPTTAPAAGEAVPRSYVDGRVIVTAVGAAAPATTGLQNGALWVEA